MELSSWSFVLLFSSIITVSFLSLKLLFCGGLVFMGGLGGGLLVVVMHLLQIKHKKANKFKRQYNILEIYPMNVNE